MRVAGQLLEAVKVEAKPPGGLYQRSIRQALDRLATGLSKIAAAFRDTQLRCHIFSDRD
jgi:hypothetical protein